jgi:hypothetical protein
LIATLFKSNGNNTFLEPSSHFLLCFELNIHTLTWGNLLL